MIDAFDAPVTLRQIPKPEPKRGEALVRVRAAGVNAADWRLWHGAYKDMQEHRFPITLGFDMAGVVETAAEGADGFRAGDEVYGTLWKQVLLDGTFADYVVSPAASFIGRKPASLDFVSAAAVPMGGQTAVTALDAMRMQANEVLLVIGATGSVGSFVTQFAAAAGVHVIATARAQEEKYARGLGAGETVDYMAGDTVGIVKARYPRGIDGVLDLVNRSTELSRVATVLHDRGRLATTLYAADPAAYHSRGIEAINIQTLPGADLLTKLRERLDATRARIPIAAEFPLDQAASALECGQRKHPLGRIVLTVS
ncbi:MAG TPA: NADP-dependent oxidoreductase [Gemmatimonadaceae bacterium]|jgi:NADPH:quinone reductase-like Zn-dependent oxidoreductase|nr:NADP-dependent oxidoreductase [Gemmatimonadaceae bacterium]